MEEGEKQDSYHNRIVIAAPRPAPEPKSDLIFCFLPPPSQPFVLSYPAPSPVRPSVVDLPAKHYFLGAEPRLFEVLRGRQKEVGLEGKGEEDSRSTTTQASFTRDFL